ncbi:MAG: hypothetical protein PHW73_02330 [Atribacterota bacterium]|nr:hypothetical protein [Atribacterota bacterium]
MYDAIVGLSFGRGSANKYLADIIKEIKKDHDIPVIVQTEIGDYYIGADNVIKEHRQKGKYLDTFEVLAQAGIILGQQNPTIILVAHPAHFYRALFIAKRLGLKIVEGRVFKAIYDKNDSQVWTRNWFLFKIWNFIAWFKIYFNILTRKI